MVTVSLYLDEDAIRVLKARSDIEQKSMSELVNQLIIQRFSTHGPLDYIR